MATSGTRPDSRGGQPERRHVEAGHRGRVGVAGPPAAALGEHDQGQPLPLGQLEQPVGLAVVHVALGAGQHAVVVGHHRDRAAVDRRGAQDQAVGRGARDEVVQRAAAALRRDGQRAVLGEAARVGQVGDVLPGRSASGGVAPLGHLGPSLVQPDPVPLPHLGQIGPDVIQRDVARPAPARRRRPRTRPARPGPLRPPPWRPPPRPPRAPGPRPAPAPRAPSSSPR